MAAGFSGNSSLIAGSILAVALVVASCGSESLTTNGNTNSSPVAAASASPTAPKTDSSGSGHGSSHDAMKSSPGAAGAPYDLQFLDTMVAHHQGAVDMAMMAATKAQHEELKQFAAKIVTDQQKEISEMKRWREDWYAGKPEAVNMEMTGMMDSMMGMDMVKMGSASGTNFDLMFIDMMTPHHDGAVKMAQEALTRAEHPEIKKLARSIMDSQAAEIKKMQAWKTQWS